MRFCEKAHAHVKIEVSLKKGRKLLVREIVSDLKLGDLTSGGLTNVEVNISLVHGPLPLQRRVD